jgi:hypothetical protein
MVRAMLQHEMVFSLHRRNRDIGQFLLFVTPKQVANMKVAFIGVSTARESHPFRRQDGKTGIARYVSMDG